MATTENGIYYPYDYNVTANVPEDMKKMAESIEKNVYKKLKDADETIKQNLVETQKDVQKNKQDISDIKEEQQTQNNNIKNLQKNDAQQDKYIEALQKENTELKEECSRLRQDLNAFPSGQAEGEYITLNDSADSRFNMFRVGGNSKQETREGYNLANLDSESYTAVGVTVTNNGDGSFTLNGTTNGAGDINLTKNVDINQTIYDFENADYLLKTIVESGSFSNSNNLLVQTACVGKIGETNSFELLLNQLSKNIFSQVIARNTNCHLSKIEIYIGGAGIVFNNYRIKVLLAKSNDTNLAWEPYGASPSSEFPSEIRNVGNNVNEIICNKNLINWDKVIEDSKDVSKTDDGYIKFYQGGNRLIIKDIFKENTQYVFTITAKKDIANSSVSLTFVYTDGSSSSANVSCQNANTDYKQTVVSEKGKTVELIRSYYSDSRVSYLKTEGTQLEEGTQATDYVPHQEQVVTFPLAENQKLYKGDYLAKDGIHHVRKQIELDGTENWQYRNTNPKGISTFSLSIVEPDYKRYDGFQAICSHFKNLGIVSAVSAMYYNDEGFSFFYNADYLALKSFYINTSQQSNLANFKNWLVQQKEAGTPVILEYELAEEEIEAYTPEQQEAYNKIVQTAKSYKNVTNIFSADTVSPTFKVNYRKDIETMLEQVQVQTNAINELLSTTKTSAILLDNLQSDLESEVM